LTIRTHRLAVAVMVLTDDGTVLLMYDHRRGWEFPGGYVEEGESLKSAAIREVEEESGIQIRLTRFAGIEQDVSRSLCVFLFEGKPIGGTLTGSDEHQDLSYFPLEEAFNKITLQIYKDRIHRYMNKKRQAFIFEVNGE
jgi:8-oxo-dGTP diphosphatase